MSELNFDAKKSISMFMSKYNRTTALELGIALCTALLETEFHGAVCPSAIVFENGEIALDKPLDGEITSLSPEALEFSAPELFWRDEREPYADIYSIGVVLYCAMSGGIRPFQPSEGEFELADRAEALRRRMKGEALPKLENAGKKFGAAIMKAVSYEKTDRFSTMAEFLAELESCPVLPCSYEGFTPAALIAEDMVLAKALDEELGTNSVEEAIAREKAQKEYKVTKDFEKTIKAEIKAEKKIEEEPKKKKKRGFFVFATVAVLAIVAVAGIAIGTFGGDDGTASVTPAIDVTPTVDATPEVTATPDVAETPEVEDEPPVETLEPLPTPTATHVVDGKYTMVLENVSWQQATENAKGFGGTLATVSSQAELDQITAMAEELGVEYVWLGASRGDDGTMQWQSGDTVDFYAWGTGEPSYTDGYDGTAEDYLLLWEVYFSGNNGWVYNDSRNDIYSYSPSIFGGKIAYVYEIG